MDHEYISLTNDTIKFLKEGHFLSDTFAVSKENALFFSSFSPKKEIKKEAKQIYKAPIATPAPAPKAASFQEPAIQTPAPIQKPLPVEAKTVDTDFNKTRKWIEKAHPHFVLVNQIPDDALAKKKAEAWKENNSVSQIAILSFGESLNDLEFLKKLAKAIQEAFTPVKLIDARRITQEKKWDSFLKEGNFKLIISPEKGVQSCFELMRLYTEIPKTQARFLGKTPLLLLASIDQYQKNLHLKRTLWTTLCQILKT